MMRDVFFDNSKKDILFLNTEGFCVWNVINTVPNSYSYIPEMGVDLDISTFIYNVNQYDIQDETSLYDNIKSDIISKLYIFGLVPNRFLIGYYDDIIKVSFSVDRIAEVSINDIR